jgi:holliday junction DNA helicase RuvA
MIGWLRGTVVDRTPKGEVIVDVGGVGYRLTVTTPALAGLSLGATATLHVHTHVREDALVLYGFPTRDARTCFEILIGTHGVGPALALAILSAHSPDRLRSAVIDDDEAALTIVPGVGKKTAARLLVELKGRFDTAEFEADVAKIGAGAAGGETSTEPEARSAVSDVRAALVELGYSPEEIRTVVKKLPSSGDASTLLRQALRVLADGAR